MAILLHELVERGDLQRLSDWVKGLSTRKDDVNYVNARGKSQRTALHMAATRHDEDTNARIIRLLVDQRADINLADKTAKTPLFLASMAGLAETAKLLLEHGAAVDAADSFGRTPLQVAVRAESVAAVQVLLDAGANVNHTDKEGKSALFWAPREPRFEGLRRLLEGRASEETLLHPRYGEVPTRLKRPRAGEEEHSGAEGVIISIQPSRADRRKQRKNRKALEPRTGYCDYGCC